MGLSLIGIWISMLQVCRLKQQPLSRTSTMLETELQKAFSNSVCVANCIPNVWIRKRGVLPFPTNKIFNGRNLIGM
jgi:hypothetical protein